jgi:hypothetical protein
MKSKMLLSVATVVMLLTAPVAADEFKWVGAHQQRPLPAETISARQKFFGLDNVDPRTGAVRSDLVILSWTGVSSFAASLKGHVVFLDAYIVREGGAPAIGAWPSIRYIGSTPEELAALKPELILFGHSHFDHMGDLPTVVRANPDALVVGTAEHCRDIKEEVTDVSFRCLSIFEAGADLGTIRELPYFLPGVGITAVKQPHSSGPPDPVADPPFPWRVEGCRTFPGLAFAQFPVEFGEPLSWDFATFGPPSGFISIAWQIRIGDFALVWQDTTGPITGACQARGEVGCERVPQAFASLPETDVRLGSIAVSGRSVLVDHNKALREKLFIPLHHDACGYFAKKDLEEVVASLPEDTRPRLWFISDPSDYLRPIVFDPEAKAWRDHARLR